MMICQSLFKKMSAALMKEICRWPFSKKVLQVILNIYIVDTELMISSFTAK